MYFPVHTLSLSIPTGKISIDVKNTRHLFHSVNPSPWPLLASFSLLIIAPGPAFYTHKVAYSGFFSIPGLCCSSHTAFYRFSDTPDEATNSGYHTLVVRKGSRSGFLLFIVSETMLFFGSFRAFSHARISPTAEVGYVLPPEGISTIEVWDFPLFNTLILIYLDYLQHEPIML